MPPRKFRLAPLLVSAVAVCAGCGGDGPADDYRDYLAALAAARYEAAFAAIAAESVAALESLRTSSPASRPTADRDELAERVAGCPDAFTAFRTLVSSGAPAFLPLVTPEAVERAAPAVVALDGSRAEVEVRTPAGPSRVALLREGGRWKVLLSGL